MPLSFPRYVLLAPPSAAPWSHCQVGHHFLTKPLLATWLMACWLLYSAQPSSLFLIVSLYLHPNCFLTCYVLLCDRLVEVSGWQRSGAGTGALSQASPVPPYLKRGSNAKPPSLPSLALRPSYSQIVKMKIPLCDPEKGACDPGKVTCDYKGSNLIWFGVWDRLRVTFFTFKL